MIQARLQINGEIKGREQITGNINGSIKNIYPELENIEINPSIEKQYLKPEKYGYNEITVKEVTSDIDKNIKPEHIKKGVTILGVNGGFLGTDTSDANASANDIRYNKTAYVDGEKVVGNLDEVAKISLNASKIEQIYGGNAGPTGIVEYSEKDIIIKKGTQISMSMPSSVLADVINVTSENLLVGNEVLGVQGTATSDATATSDTIIEGEVAYAKGQKITGNIKNNGELNFMPSANLQQIPKGYTSGGTIQSVDITTLEDYQVCEDITDSILEGVPMYKRIEYIEGNGTQYIDTEIIPTNHKIETQLENLTYTDSKTMFGTTNFQVHLTWFSNRWYFACGAGDQNYSANCLGKQTIIFNDENKKIIRNGIEVATTNGTTEATDSLFLFRRGYLGDTGNSSARIYYFKIYERDTNELIRDMIPVLDENKIACLYDKVSKKYFYNKGTGDFIAGGVI